MYSSGDGNKSRTVERAWSSGVVLPQIATCQTVISPVTIPHSMLAESFKVAAAQLEPVFQDREASLDKACRWIQNAGDANVDLLVFPEAFVSGYPYWVETDEPSRWSERMVDLQKHSLHVEDDAIEVIAEEAASGDVNVVLGANELSNRPGSDTVYNSLFYFDRSGSLLGRHRKLMPTHLERTVWGRGDPKSLDTHELDIGTLGGLICYENHMTLSKGALCAKGEEIHAATWPGFWSIEDGSSNPDQATAHEIIQSCDIYPAVREYAFETQSFVVSASTYLSEETMAELNGDNLDYSWISGGSMLVGPTGHVSSGPVFGEETLVTAEFLRDERRRAKAYFDSMGHYSRWDAVSLQVRETMYDPMQSIPASTSGGDGPDSEQSVNRDDQENISKPQLERLAHEHGISVDTVEEIIRHSRN